MEEKSSLASCGCGIILIAFNLLVGSWSVNYLLGYFLDQTIPFLGAALIGLAAGEITVPVAVAVWVLRSFGVL